MNFASRLVEEIAEKDEIIISKELKNIVGEQFDFENIKVKERKSHIKTKKEIKSFTSL